MNEIKRKASLELSSMDLDELIIKHYQLSKIYRDYIDDFETDASITNYMFHRKSEIKKEIDKKLKENNE